MNIQVNNLVHNLHLARQKARLLGTDVVLCKSADKRQCSTQPGWHAGWLMFANNDRDNPPQTDAGETMLAFGDRSNRLQISANRHAFVMRPFGKRSTNGTFIYCDRRGSAAAREIIVSYTGKPRVYRATSSSPAPICPATDE